MIFIYMSEMTNEEIAKAYLQWVAGNLDSLKVRMQRYCTSQHMEYDEDVFSDTYLKIYEKILKSGLKDTTPEGMLNYTFMAFKTNTRREPMYARHRLRDLNVEDDKLNDLYEQYINGQIGEREKLANDLFKDYATLYIMYKAEEQFPREQFHLFKLKFMGNLTFKQLRQKTGAKGAREKVNEVLNWLRENVTKEDIRESFNEIFGGLIC